MRELYRANYRNCCTLPLLYNKLDVVLMIHKPVYYFIA